MCSVVVIALSAKLIPAALLTAVGANRDSAIFTLSNGWVAARERNGSITLSVFASLTVMAVLKEVIERKGLFCALYSDRGSHFWLTPRWGGQSRLPTPDAGGTGPESERS